MINIQETKDCCGCEACVQVCPVHCIFFFEDKEGFRYPKVDQEKCTECSLCEKVCLVLNQGTERKPLSVYAAQNKDEEIRRQSSSGGIFTLLAEQTLQEGGVVFGAKFNADWEVVHDFTETVEGLAAFRGSKYVQSRIGDVYKQVKQFLKTDRKVLFSGTPCQVAGLKLFLRKEYENLLAVDFICHGVPSPMVWRKYLGELIALKGDQQNSVLSHLKPSILNSIRDVSRIEFRNKVLGWKKFSFALTLSVPDGYGAKNSVLHSEPLNKNIFMRGFLSDLYLRPSCHACPAKSLKSGSDITIADFWGIQNVLPDFDDDKGTSLVSVNSEKGKAIYESLSVFSALVAESALQKVLFESCKPHSKRKQFFDRVGTEPLLNLIHIQTKVSFLKRLRSYLGRGKRFIKQVIQ